MKKTFKYILIVLLGLWFLFYLLPAGLLCLPSVQKQVGGMVAGFFEEKIGTKVEIGSVELGFLNKLVLKEVRLVDEKDSLLFRAERIAAGFETIPLLKKQFRFHSAQLISFDLYLRKDSPDSPLNIDYIIQAFASDTTKKRDPIDLKITSLHLFEGNIHYDVENQAFVSNRIDKNHLAFDNITGRIQLNELKDKTIDTEIKRLRFHEKSGLQVDNLAIRLRAKDKNAVLEYLALELPSSKLLLEQVSIDANKESFEGADLQFRFVPSHIASRDLLFLFPKLKDLNDTFHIQGNASGSLNNISLRNISLKESYGSSLYITGNIKGLLKEREEDIYIRADIDKSMITSNFIRRLHLDEQIEALGNTKLQGSLSGTLNNLNFTSLIQTNIGQLQANASMQRNAKDYILRGQFISEGLELKQVFPKSEFGNTAFDVIADITYSGPKRYTAEVNASIPHFEYKDIQYEDITIKGTVTPDKYIGSIGMEGTQGKLFAEGLFMLKDEYADFNFMIDAKDLQLGSLINKEGYEHALLSLEGEVDFRGNDIDNVLGHVLLENLSLTTTDKDFELPFFSIDVQHNQGEKNILIDSDILFAQLKGDYSSRTLWKQLKQTVSHYLPSLKEEEALYEDYEEDNKFEFSALIGNTDDLATVLNIPIKMSEGNKVNGSFDSKKNELHLDASFPELYVSGNSFKDIAVLAYNEDEKLKLLLETVTVKNNYNLGINAQISAQKDAVHSILSWEASREKRYDGYLNLTTRLSSKNEEVNAFININPSEVVFNDSVWIIHPATINLTPNRIAINNMKGHNNDQSIIVNGVVSHDPQDIINVDMNNLDMASLFEILNIPALQFGGKATGKAEASDLFGQMKASTHLDVKDFSFNQTLFGNLDLDGAWMNESKLITMKGIVVEDGTSYTGIDGYIQPIDERINITFNAHHAPVSFVRKYLNNITPNMSGRATGEITLLGDLNNPTISGAVLADNCSFEVDYLNTKYSFSDYIYFTPETIMLDDITLFDIYGNQAKASGMAVHNAFADFRYDVTIAFNKFLAYNATEHKNPNFYGKIMATGSAHIEGTEKHVNINISAENTKKTKLALDFFGKQDVAEYNFIRFVNPNDTNEEENIINENNKPSNNGTVFNLGMSLVINENAEIETVMDAAGEDKITTTGEGNLTMKYSSVNPMELKGYYTIKEGKYAFSLEQLYRLNFIIEEGSTITFPGDPEDADLNVTAIHKVRANLNDLDPQLLQLSTKSSVPVNCILSITGKLENPILGFNIELPDATPELERQVLSYMRTDEMKTRQFMYLLALGRFYTSSEFVAGSERTTNDFSYLTSTLAKQLLNTIGSFSEKVQIGTQFYQSNEGDLSTTEVEVSVSSAFLNDRLIVGGNVGYIDNPYINAGNANKAPLVGDFDIEYKLTPGGDIRLKGFNHYNYRNYYSSTPEMTQGVGITFRRDFNHFRDLVPRFLRKKQPKAKPEEEPNSEISTEE